MHGLGFPYLSPLCYWYLVAGEDVALDHLTLADVGADVRSLVTKVLCGNFRISTLQENEMQHT